MTILCIDDEAIDVAAISRILEREGFEVLSGNSYDEALQIFAKKSADIGLALLDVSLPGKTGIELAHTLLRIKPNLKILFVSGYVGAEVIRMHGMSLRDRHFLRKPFQADELVSRVLESLKSSEPLSWAKSPKAADAEEESDDGKLS